MEFKHAPKKAWIIPELKKVGIEQITAFPGVGAGPSEGSNAKS